MAAREMVIGKFINQIGFRIDHSTVQQVKNTVESVKSGIKAVQGVADEVKKSVNDNIDEIQKKAQKARSETEKLPEFKPGQKSTQNAKSAIDEIKDYAKKTLGVLGIGFSLAQLRSLAEEFGGINDAIRGATRELGDQSEIQQKILKGAQDCREEYGAMAGSVTKLIQQNGKLFPVDDAVKFVSLVEKLEKGAGREANIDSTMDVLTEAMSSGKLDKTGFANLKSKAPEVVNAISSAVGVSEAQLQKLAESGKLSAKQLKDAFFVSESEIQKNFDELGFDITDALKYVRNEWGLLIADLDDTFGITTCIGKAIRDGSDFLIGKAQKFTSWLKSVSDKLGGVEQLLKLIALAAAALFLGEIPRGGYRRLSALVRRGNRQCVCGYRNPHGHRHDAQRFGRQRRRGDRDRRRCGYDVRVCVRLVAETSHHRLSQFGRVERKTGGYPPRRHRALSRASRRSGLRCRGRKNGHKNFERTNRPLCLTP